MKGLLQLWVRKYSDAVGLKGVLTSRDLANKMLLLAVEELANLQPGMIVDCSFSEILICDYSFVDEFLFQLQLKILQMDNILLRLTSCENDVLENIRAGLAFRNEKIKKQQETEIQKINLLYYEESKYEILGHIEKGTAQAFDVVLNAAESGVSARMLGDELDIEANNSSANRLKKLYDLRLVCRRELLDEAGRQFFYYIPLHKKSPL